MVAPAVTVSATATAGAAHCLERRPTPGGTLATRPTVALTCCRCTERMQPKDKGNTTASGAVWRHGR
uniref:Putative secreted protein n=1 Tax=Anopheles darlingi TaxID=43151 RepID=A0A2M4D9C6_ANODA